MATYRLVPEQDWERAMRALDVASAALQRCGLMTLPDMPSDIPTGRAVDGVVLARQVIAQVDAGGPRHVPKRFDRSGPKISDFVAAVTNGDPFKITDLIDPLQRYVALKDTRRKAGGQVRTAVAHDSRFQQVDRGVFQRSAVGNDAPARTLTEEMR